MQAEAIPNPLTWPMASARRSAPSLLVGAWALVILEPHRTRGGSFARAVIETRGVQKPGYVSDQHE